MEGIESMNKITASLLIGGLSVAPFCAQANITFDLSWSTDEAEYFVNPDLDCYEVIFNCDAAYSPGSGSGTFTVDVGPGEAFTFDDVTALDITFDTSGVGAERYNYLYLDTSLEQRLSGTVGSLGKTAIINGIYLLSPSLDSGIFSFFTDNFGAADFAQYCDVCFSTDSYFYRVDDNAFDSFKVTAVI